MQLKKALKGLKIEVTHRKDSHQQFMVKGITSLPLNELEFPLDDQGTKKRVLDYFREKYDYKLRLVLWPCLQSGSNNKPIYLPMEVCKIVQGQRYSKKLNEKQVTGILRSMCQFPPQRRDGILEMLKCNNKNGDEDHVEGDFGIGIAQDLAPVEARILPTPELQYNDSGTVTRIKPVMGQWDMINKKMVTAARVDYWACINFSSIKNSDVTRFCRRLIQICSNCGMVCNPEPIITTRTLEDPVTLVDALQDVQKNSDAELAHRGIKGKQLQLLIVILPDANNIYGSIKRICETELGIISQCCLQKNISNPKSQYLANLALKINIKVGGQNTRLSNSTNIGLARSVPTMIFGADVSHPPPGEDSSSIAAVVASMDWPEMSKYRCLISTQPQRQEIIQHLYREEKDQQNRVVHGGMIRELLAAFNRRVGRWPQSIIFYRDGVSEGQFNHVLLHELIAIRKACYSLGGDCDPRITFVVVQKRHHTRLFPDAHAGRDAVHKSGNIAPGTVVDKKICHPTEFDFYLCSHAGIQGTSRPTHYHVLWDDNGFTADALQLLTYNLCYTYVRCTRSVSVVPPAYYAHLVAFRARLYTQADEQGGGSTSAGARNTRERRVEGLPLPSIKENVKDVMFFC